MNELIFILVWFVCVYELTMLSAFAQGTFKTKKELFLALIPFYMLGVLSVFTMKVFKDQWQQLSKED